MTNKVNENKPGLVLGIVLITILLFFLIGSWILGISTERPAHPGPGVVFMGLFIVSLGIMFAISYYIPSRSFFLRWLLKFSMDFAYFNRFPFLLNQKKAVFVIAGFCIFFGLLTILKGFDVLP